jgi:DNA-binding HxlR family transcriptional regulator
MSASHAKTYACPVQLTLDIVGGKWKPLILWLLRRGPRRFNDLLKAMPVTHKVLAQQLRQLERDGLIARRVVGEPQLRIDYRLTEFGATLRPVMNEMAAWAKRHHGRLGATIERADDGA